MSTDNGEVAGHPVPSEPHVGPTPAAESATRPEPAAESAAPAAAPVGAAAAPPGWTPPQRRPWRTYTQSRPLQLVAALLVGLFIGGATVGVAALAFEHLGSGDGRGGHSRFDDRGRGGQEPRRPLQDGPRRDRRLPPPGPGAPSPSTPSPSTTPPGATPSATPTA